MACGSGDSRDVFNPLDSSELTDSEACAISNVFIGAMNGANMEFFASQGALAQSGLALWQGDAQSGAGALAVGFPLNGQSGCQISGRVSWTGNVSVSVDIDNGIGTIFGLITFRISDPTNNLNDCQVAPGVILDGSLTLTMAGNTDERVGLWFAGEIEINERGPTGGLYPPRELLHQPERSARRRHGDGLRVRKSGLSYWCDHHRCRNGYASLRPRRAQLLFGPVPLAGEVGHLTLQA
jgi:hypothetical protein